MSAALRDSARRIGSLAWPVFIGQLSVVAFSTVDTVLIGRHSTTDLAALSVGAAAYITVFIGFMGMVMALGPIAGQLFGAGKLAQAGHQLHQAVWLALALSLPGSALLLFPEPFLALSRLGADEETRVRAYLQVLALSLPASLLFSCYRGFNTAVSRPKAVMALQLGGLALKVPLSMLLIGGVPVLGLPALGVVGCASATAIVMWSQVLAAAWVLRRDDFYRRFEIWGRGLHRPDTAALGAQLKLGIPMGLSILIDVSGFSLMAVFIARTGSTAVAGHQIAANLVSLLFMLPLALASATSTLVAQAVGARRSDDARRVGWHGVQIGMGVALMLGSTVFLARGEVVRLYTQDAAVIAAALPLLAWVALFHAADAGQALTSFVLRGHRIATAPMFVHAASMWGVGLGGGFVLAFDVLGSTPAALRGAPGYWAASTAGLTLAFLGMTMLLLQVHRRQRRAQSNALPAAGT